MFTCLCVFCVRGRGLLMCESHEVACVESVCAAAVCAERKSVHGVRMVCLSAVLVFLCISHDVLYYCRLGLQVRRNRLLRKWAREACA